MKWFLINVDTAWPGTDATFRAEAGMSPLSVVYQRDLEYEKLMNKSNEIQG